MVAYESFDSTQSNKRLSESIKWSPTVRKKIIINALFFYQIFLTNSYRKCMEISLWNLYVNIGAIRVKGFTEWLWCKWIVVSYVHRCMVYLLDTACNSSVLISNACILKHTYIHLGVHFCYSLIIHGKSVNFNPITCKFIHYLKDANINSTLVMYMCILFNKVTTIHVLFSRKNIPFQSGGDKTWLRLLSFSYITALCISPCP